MITVLLIFRENCMKKSFLTLSAVVIATVGAAISFSSHASKTMEASAEAALQKNQYPSYPKITLPQDAQKRSQITRGEYLVKMGDCIACHSRYYSGHAFEGGFPIATPFGTIYTPNITSDKTYGIGAWSDQQFIKAMRDGVNPKGQFYYPAFPYLYFNSLTTQDLKDIKAYLDVVPAVHQANHKNSMMFPFNWRFLQLGWRILFFYEQRPGQFTPNPKQSAELNRGRYLVDGLGHCSMCHTPSYYFLLKDWQLAAPINKYYLTGAMVQGFYAPNITRATFKDTAVKDIQDVFYKNQMIGGGKVQGPMYEANRDSLQYLTQSDSAAIANYLKTVVSQTPPAPKSSGTGPGADIYNQHCQGCHSTGAGGAPKVGDAQVWAPLIQQGITVLYKNAINGINGMPAKGTCSSCTDTQIQETVEYMVNESKPGAGGDQGTFTLVPDKQEAPLTLADGKKIYGQYCAACHNGAYPGAPVLGDKAAWQPLIAQGMMVLFQNTIDGIGNHPARGSCAKCNGAELKAAMKYMVEEGKTSGNYDLW